MSTVSIQELIDLGVSRDEIPRLRTGASQFLRGVDAEIIDSANFDDQPAFLGTAMLARGGACHSTRRRVAVLDFRSRSGAAFSVAVAFDAEPTFGCPDESIHLIAFYPPSLGDDGSGDYLLDPLRSQRGRLFLLHGSVFLVYSDDTPEVLNYFLHARAKELAQCREFASKPLTPPEPR